MYVSNQFSLSNQRLTEYTRSEGLWSCLDMSCWWTANYYWQGHWPNVDLWRWGFIKHFVIVWYVIGGLRLTLIIQGGSLPTTTFHGAVISHAQGVIKLKLLFCHIKNGRSVISTQQTFRLHYKKTRAPERDTIRPRQSQEHGDLTPPEPLKISRKSSEQEYAPVWDFAWNVKTLFMSNHDLLIFFNMSNQFLAPGGLNAECVQFSVM